MHSIDLGEAARYCCVNGIHNAPDVWPNVRPLLPAGR